ncbi:MAG: PD-(D/E)XK nuclease family protein, partial [Verrucomicrobiales bacterium]|nr:PD-(D/E)XK nuclease family protein [Verrucomicrobiales bacterium]
RNAGRRLREALAAATLEQEGALLPPRLMVPEDFFQTGGGADGVTGAGKAASSAAAKLAWMQELMAIDLDEYEVLFPVKPPEQGADWAGKVADELLHARAALAEGGMLVKDLPDEVEGQELPERERWRQVAALEKRVMRRLQGAGLADAEAVKIANARAWQVPQGVEKVVLMAVPDPLQLMIFALAGGLAEEVVPLEVCIYAPQELEAGFDDWGRAEASFWQQRIFSALRDEHIHLAADAEGQKDAVLDFLRTRRERESLADHAVAVGCADADVVAVLKSALNEVGVEVFDPDGQPFRKHSLYHFLDGFAKYLKSGRFCDFLEMLRNASWLDSLAAQFGKNVRQDVGSEGEQIYFNKTGILRAFDELKERALPRSCEDALEALRRDQDREGGRHRPLAGQWLAMDVIRDLERGFRERPFAEAVEELLRAWLGDRQVGSEDDDATLLANIGDRSHQLAGEMSQVVSLTGKRGAGLGVADLFEVLLDSLAELRYYPGDRHASDLELQGWLELAWEGADDLVISGMNDGLVPSAVIGDMFLPDALRSLLDLRDNADRFARDAYLLESMLTWRLQQGHEVKLLVGKLTAGGDLLKPSRLLFQCEDADLPRRALNLFAEDAKKSKSERALPAWNLSWKLEVPFDREYLMEKKPQSLSGTTFSAYLSCPFRFILKRLLGTDEVDSKKVEMNAMEFGSLCHRALEVLGPDSEWVDERDFGKVYEALKEAVRVQVSDLYGAKPPATVLLQSEVAINRLSLAARHHVAALEQGWRVVATEKVFGKGDEPWLLAGMPVTGTIDRIEKNDQGCYRLIDYKTSGKASGSFEAHLQVLKRTESEEDFPDWMLYELPEDGKIYRWINLQLPVYALWAERYLAAERGKGLVDSAYVNLPKALSDGGYSAWRGGMGMDAGLLRSAQACVEGVIGQVQKGQFWPPAKKLKYDDFKKLGFPDFVESLDWDAFEAVFSDVNAKGELRMEGSADE